MRKRTRTYDFKTLWVNAVSEKMFEGMDSDEAAAAYSLENQDFKIWYKVLNTMINAGGTLARDENEFFWLCVEHEIDLKIKQNELEEYEY